MPDLVARCPNCRGAALEPEEGTATRFVTWWICKSCGAANEDAHLLREPLADDDVLDIFGVDSGEVYP